MPVARTRPIDQQTLSTQQPKAAGHSLAVTYARLCRAHTQWHAMPRAMNARKRTRLGRVAQRRARAVRLDATSLGRR